MRELNAALSELRGRRRGARGDHHRRGRQDLLRGRRSRLGLPGAGRRRRSSASATAWCGASSASPSRWSRRSTGTRWAAAARSRWAATSASSRRRRGWGRPSPTSASPPASAAPSGYPRLIGRGLALEHLILGTQIPAAECLPHRARQPAVARKARRSTTPRPWRGELAKRPPIATAAHHRGGGRRAPRAHRPGHRDRDARLPPDAQDRGRGRGHPGLLPKRPPDFKGR